MGWDIVWEAVIGEGFQFKAEPKYSNVIGRKKIWQVAVMEKVSTRESLIGGSHATCASVAVLSAFRPPWRRTIITSKAFVFCFIPLGDRYCLCLNTSEQRVSGPREGVCVVLGIVLIPEVQEWCIGARTGEHAGTPFASVWSSGGDSIRSRFLFVVLVFWFLVCI